MTHRYVYRCEGVSLVGIKRFVCLDVPWSRKPRMGSTAFVRGLNPLLAVPVTKGQRRL